MPVKRALPSCLGEVVSPVVEDEMASLLIALEIDREGDAHYEAFVSGGLVFPDALTNQPRTLFDLDEPEPSKAKFYDQIARFETGSSRKLSLAYISAESFNFAPYLFPADPALSLDALSYRVSDHLPLWVKFRVPGSGAPTDAQA